MHYKEWIINKLKMDQFNKCDCQELSSINLKLNQYKRLSQSARIIILFSFILIDTILTNPMLRQRPLQHKRKNSQLQLFHPSILPLSKKSQQKKLTAKNKTSNENKKTKLTINQNKSNARSILKLLQNSSKLVQKKQTVIQHIDYDQWGDENVDCGNGAMHQSNADSNEETNESYFQFGRRSRSSMQKEQPYSSETLQFNNCVSNYCLDMDEIMEVPDTMSNERRYQNSSAGKFYHFTTMMEKENTSKKTQNNLKDDLLELKNKENMEKVTCINQPKANLAKKQQPVKNLKNRKQKLPKNIIMGAQNEQIQKTIDLSELSKCNKKSKLFFFNNKKDTKSKSKEMLRNVQKEKSRQSLLVNTKSKHLLSQSVLGKKKSLSLKNETNLKLSQQKPKSTQGPRDLTIQQHTKPISQPLTNPKQSRSTKKLSQSIANKPITRNLQIGQKIQMIEQSQSKLQSQYKVLWECVGELWQNSRITRYISEKNKEDIGKIKEEEEKLEGKMVKLKREVLTEISSARY